MGQLYFDLGAAPIFSHLKLTGTDRMKDDRPIQYLLSFTFVFFTTVMNSGPLVKLGFCPGEKPRRIETARGEKTLKGIRVDCPCGSHRRTFYGDRINDRSRFKI